MTTLFNDLAKQSLGTATVIKPSLDTHYNNGVSLSSSIMQDSIITDPAKLPLTDLYLEAGGIMPVELLLPDLGDQAEPDQDLEEHSSLESEQTIALPDKEKKVENTDSKLVEEIASPLRRMEQNQIITRQAQAAVEIKTAENKPDYDKSLQKLDSQPVNFNKENHSASIAVITQAKHNNASLKTLENSYKSSEELLNQPIDIEPLIKQENTKIDTPVINNKIAQSLLQENKDFQSISIDKAKFTQEVAAGNLPDINYVNESMTSSSQKKPDEKLTLQSQELIKTNARQDQNITQPSSVESNKLELTAKIQPAENKQDSVIYTLPQMDKVSLEKSENLNKNPVVQVKSNIFKGESTQQESVVINNKTDQVLMQQNKTFEPIRVSENKTSQKIITRESADTSQTATIAETSVEKRPAVNNKPVEIFKKKSEKEIKTLEHELPLIDKHADNSKDSTTVLPAKLEYLIRPKLSEIKQSWPISEKLDHAAKTEKKLNSVKVTINRLRIRSQAHKPQTAPQHKTVSTSILSLREYLQQGEN